MAGTDTKKELTAKGLVFGRETRVRIPPPDKNAGREVFAICLRTDDEELLRTKKAYKIKLAGDRAIVVDEEGEVAVYPLDFFLVLSLTSTAKNTLAEVIG